MIKNLLNRFLKKLYGITTYKSVNKFINIYRQLLLYTTGCRHRGVMVEAMDWGIVVNEFVFQSRYYVHFWANTLGKGMNPPYPPIYGLNSSPTVLLG